MHAGNGAAVSAGINFSEPRILSGHTHFVLDCVVTPDSQRIVSASKDRTLKVWDLWSGKCERTLSGHMDSVLACFLTPDGQQVLSVSSDDTLKVWNLSSGVCERTLSGHTDLVWACRVTPDGQRMVSASADKTLRVWELGVYREHLKEAVLLGEPQASSALFKYDLNPIPFSRLPAIFTQADQQNNASAQAQLGYHYWQGIGLPKDMELARYWYTQSGQQGNAAATAWLAAHTA